MEPSDFGTAFDAIDAIDRATTSADVHAYLNKCLPALGCDYELLFAIHQKSFERGRGAENSSGPLLERNLERNARRLA